IDVRYVLAEEGDEELALAAADHEHRDLGGVDDLRHPAQAPPLLVHGLETQKVPVPVLVFLEGGKLLLLEEDLEAPEFLGALDAVHALELEDHLTGSTSGGADDVEAPGLLAQVHVFDAVERLAIRVVQGDRDGAPNAMGPGDDSHANHGAAPSIQDLQHNPSPLDAGPGPDQGAERLDRLALAPDHPAQILRSDAEGDGRGGADALRGLHLVGRVGERLGDVFDEVAHGPQPSEPWGARACFRRSERTVSVM